VFSVNNQAQREQIGTYKCLFVYIFGVLTFKNALIPQNGLEILTFMFLPLVASIAEAVKADYRS
jgi:hypothetical protein